MLKRPNNIAICLNAPTVKRALEQKQQLLEIESEFNIEWDIRAERIEGRMTSYSQMINESVIATESEFMVFINPSTQPTVQDINTIIDDLCNGYAMSSIIAFGFYGLTKEVFRRIGMMDERFLGGNHEDTDFLLRLKQSNFAVNYRFRENQYTHWHFKTGAPPKLTSQLSGIAVSLFPLKWCKIEKTFYRTDLLLKEKQLPSRLLKNKRHDIFKSWKTWDESEYEWLPDDNVFMLVWLSDISNIIATSYKTTSNATLKIISKDKNDNSTTALDLNCPNLQDYRSIRNGNLLFFEFLFDKPVEIIIQILDKESRPLGFAWKFFKENTYEIDDFDADSCIISVLHGGRLILHHNNFSLLGADESYTFGLDVYEFSVE